jgi:hypothetical protein
MVLVPLDIIIEVMQIELDVTKITEPDMWEHAVLDPAIDCISGYTEEFSGFLYR